MNSTTIENALAYQSILCLNTAHLTYRAHIQVIESELLIEFIQMLRPELRTQNWREEGLPDTQEWTDIINLAIADLKELRTNIYSAPESFIKRVPVRATEVQDDSEQEFFRKQMKRRAEAIAKEIKPVL